MAQTKTSLILNNLIELRLPLDNCPCLTITTRLDSATLSVDLPALFLLQKVHFEQCEPSMPFTDYFTVQSSSRQSSQATNEIIDFKREKIDWRCKTRMRSNSNEFLDCNNEPDISSDTVISEDSDVMNLEGHHTMLVSAIGRRFEFRLVPIAETKTSDLPKYLQSIKLDVWPCFRMPLGGSSISLINNSFLFASR
jgi:hypothetical protein